ncbi:uncharacterized protein MONOS_1858 [Monocercomonoides exilis]|uniref:uncharacterized protein n=1 Tax=Monocercomonoides exilis TaxID=2049356 RepID=UPI00355A23CE|nr:hypothetical protein MONOS_1858 [Monocercomonoides exilis]|eukprot:MONOS_1858.1-p1 / transcript=MONOS_1858.1 / gene=MONOS_1858 / organism=Monocercomonoides_exilis_PA203 / gene_product=unspecified product / transcript_product=unspecified product / location=Mono_scaffold00035:58325-59214(-) / protein_length=154 / sequence_SO=supercontig / SO=protein_coding / is_pseudo=false
MKIIRADQLTFKMLSQFSSSTLLYKILLLVLLLIVVFSMINNFFTFSLEDLAIAIVGFYALNNKTSGPVWFYILLCGFSTFFQIIHLIIIGVVMKGLYGRVYWIIMSVILIVLKLASCGLSFLCRNEIQNGGQSQPSPYSSAPSSANTYSATV